MPTMILQLSESQNRFMRRMEQGQHVMFHRKRPGGILVTRILHQRMQPERHLSTSSGE